ncbi:hypothetical protein [Formosa maritima]|uniref:Uncharacterized protein n=1 Tax=Formosa maritima TaxID=2592046 RepID=A0A5D0GJC1_9FLAO|nr:hypothetical protein [Formosa maritima]TYA59074.1 hypothetical protein FVF61_02685 [Formosa maritima]
MVFKLSTLILVLALLTPSVVKFTHIFSHHKHEVCKGESKTHLHTLDIDCTFHKFKLNNQYTFTVQSYNLFDIDDNYNHIFSQYLFLNTFQPLHFTLRGPPFNS